ncbi:uncharacterized protein LOC124170023 [Ischnura elegans]|uniref:uncharacterized protein LOC124170023 n=1 Tax=Ischnura elegans TaxID=197161 RepID=UPI001ED8A3F2|nr:uncharacterized protein LOC124170023 [Ischnura elegans]
MAAVNGTVRQLRGSIRFKTSIDKMHLAPALPTPLSSEFGENAEVGSRIEIGMKQLDSIIREQIVVRGVETVTEPLLKAEGGSSEEGNRWTESGERQSLPMKYDSYSAGYNGYLNRQDKKDVHNVRIVVTFCTFIITVLMVYGAVRNKPSYLMPYFCLQVFDFCIACLSILSFLCRVQDKQIDCHFIPVPLDHVSPQSCAFLLVLITTISIALKAYLINVVWRCYKYLSLRRIAQLRTVHVIDSPHEAMPVAPDSAFSHQEALLLLPDYETAISDPRYAVPTVKKAAGKKEGGGGEVAVGFDVLMAAPPPAYSYVMQEANQVVPDKAESVPHSTVSQERAVPASPAASPSRQEPVTPPAGAAVAGSSDDAPPPST